MKLRRYAEAAIALTLAAGMLAGTNVWGGQYKASLFSGMKYRLIGPFRGGRALAVTGLPQDSSTYYFGAVAGGVWKTTDGGLSWKPIFDKEPIASIGAIAVASSDPNVIYVGTGESCPRNDISYGDGIYKSTDEGKTWAKAGLTDTRHIAAIIVDPHDPNIVLVAALGHAYGPNAERGVFRSTDGGKTWTKVLYKDDKTGAIDLIFDPNNSRIVYAALWQVARTPYSLEDGGPGSGLYKSLDGGLTWKHLTGGGLPGGILGRIGIAIPAANPSRVYAQIEARDGGLYASNDAGATWQFVNGDDRFRQRAFYFTHIFADPQNANTIYELNTGTYRSTDGGKTFQPLREPHGDCHDLWIDPSNPKRMIEGNDGGATITVDGGKTWSTEGNQPTAQFYRVTTDNQFFYHVYG
ncbi:MAG: WD40/YVTN/BNR-like repeat-containing protein, partial [Terriglobia bacterium]